MDIISAFKIIDVFGVEFNAAIFSKRQYKTLYGTFLTVVFFVLAIYKLGIMISQAINKTNFTVTEEKDILSGEEQNITTPYLAVCAGKYDNKTFYYYPMASDNESDISPEYNETFSNETDNNCYFYNITNSIISSGVESSDGKKLMVMIFEHTLIAQLDGLTLYIDETFIKRSDYHNPVRHKNYQITVSRIATMSQVLKIYLQTIRVIYKNTYNFGFINYEPISAQNYTSYYSNSIESSTNYGSESETPGVIQSLTVIIYHSDWIYTYTFSGFELDTTLSEFGGYINICFIIINFIGQLINRYLLKKYVTMELNKGVSYEKSVNNKRKKTINEVSVKNNNLNIAESINEIRILNSFGRMEDINHDNIKKKYTIANIRENKKINFPNIPINPGITGEQDDSKIIICASNKLINSTSNKEQTEEMQGKKDQEMFKLFKDECDKISDEINSRDELYKSLLDKYTTKEEKENIRYKINNRLFEDSMDYSYFYIILKELKLLELLVLKPDDAKLLLDYNNKLLDFNKLFNLMNNKSIQGKIFYSQLYKEYAINKCLI